MDLLESNSLNIEQPYKNIGDTNLNEDPKNIKKHILDRILRNDITSPVNFMNCNVEPDEYSDLLKSQSTSIAVGRSFSLLNNLLSESRNFNDENILSYFCVIIIQNR